MIKNIIFDFDGVLVDSEILVAKAFSKYLAKRNILFSEKEFSIHAGKKTIEVIDELSSKFHIKNVDEFYKDIMTIAHNIYSDELTPVLGAKKFLESNNLNCFIGSNSTKERIIAGLKKVNFENFFPEEKIFSFDMVNKPKPNPDVYLLAIESYKIIK